MSTAFGLMGEGWVACVNEVHTGIYIYVPCLSRGISFSGVLGECMNITRGPDWYLELDKLFTTAIIIIAFE